MIKLFIPIRNVQNGDKIKLVGRKRWNQLSGCFEKDAYAGYEGVVSGVDPLEDNSFVLENESSVLVCPGRNYWGYTPGTIYVMNGKTYRCMKTQEIPRIFTSYERTDT